MTRNRWIHYGALIAIASALIWVGAELTKHIVWIVPYAGILGALLIVVGLVLEQKRGRKKREADVIKQ